MNENFHKKLNYLFKKPEIFTLNSNLLAERLKSNIIPTVYISDLSQEDASNFLKKYKTYNAQNFHIKNLKEKYNGIIPKLKKEKNFQTSTSGSLYPFEKWEADIVYIKTIFTSRFNFKNKELIDEKIYDQNDLYKYLLCMIDTFTKYAFVKLLKNKKAKSVEKAFHEILNQEIEFHNYLSNLEGYKENIFVCLPNKIATDNGKEFNNEFVKNLMNYYQIELNISEGYHHLSIIERFNRTIKEKIFYYISILNENNNTFNYRFIDFLDILVDNYNNTKHMSTRVEPIFLHYTVFSFNQSLRERIWRKIQNNILATYNKINEKIDYENNVGDIVNVKLKKLPLLTTKEKFEMCESPF